MAVIEIVHEDGRRASVTPKRFADLRSDGWREWTDEDRRDERAKRVAARTAPPPEPAQRARKSTATPAEPVGDADSTAVKATPEHEEQNQ